MTARVQRWMRIQRQIALRRIEVSVIRLPRYVAGVDCALTASGKSIVACAVVWDRKLDRVVDLSWKLRKLNVPYIPGFLSFREAPAIIGAIGKLKHDFGAVLVDGQGIAHPRRCGLATHLGVRMNLVSVGVAKSRYIGTFDEPPDVAGRSSRLMDRGEQIGVVLRTRAGVTPVFVSVGNRIDFRSSIRLVRACVTHHRVPEPTRIADREVAKLRLL